MNEWNNSAPNPAEASVPVQTQPVPAPAAAENPGQPLPPVAPVAAAVPEARHENVLAGVVGAFLLALVGGVLYFIIYQFGYIAGICGLITVVLANFGYQKFSGAKDSLKGVVVAIVISVAVIFLGEFFGLSYEIYNVFHTEYDITFFEAVRATPSFLTEPEIWPSFLIDLGIAYVLGGVASFSTIRQACRRR